MPENGSLMITGGECEKCGAVCGLPIVTVEQVYSHELKKWVENKRSITANVSTTFVKLSPGQGCLCGLSNGAEHLHRKCMVCGFYWSEQTITSRLIHE